MGPAQGTVRTLQRRSKLPSRAPQAATMGAWSAHLKEEAQIGSCARPDVRHERRVPASAGCRAGQRERLRCAAVAPCRRGKGHGATSRGVPLILRLLVTRQESHAPRYEARAPRCGAASQQRTHESTARLLRLERSRQSLGSARLFACSDRCGGSGGGRSRQFDRLVSRRAVPDRCRIGRPVIPTAHDAPICNEACRASRIGQRFAGSQLPLHRGRRNAEADNGRGGSHARSVDFTA